MPKRPQVYVTRRLPQAILNRLRQEADLQIWPGESPPPYAVLHRALETADGALLMPDDQIDRRMLVAASQLRVVTVCDDRANTVDVAAATEQGILVTCAPGLTTEAVADFTLLLMLAAARRLPDALKYVKAGYWRAWGAETLLGRELSGATLGIIGMGRVGQAVARRAHAFGMQICYSTPKPLPQRRDWEALPLATLLARSDVVSLHCPLTDATFHMLNRATLALLKPQAILINTAHGLLIDTAALVEALHSRAFIAALDATSPEPLPPAHPLLNMNNVLVTPHVAAAGNRSRAQQFHTAVESLLAALRGERPDYLINQELWPPLELTLGDSGSPPS